MKELSAAALAAFAALSGMCPSRRQTVKAAVALPPDWTFTIEHAAPGYFPIDVDRHGNSVAGEASPPGEDAALAEYLADSLRPYPAECLQAAGLKSVVIGRRLVGVGPETNHVVSGATDVERGVLHVGNIGFDVLSATSALRHRNYLNHEFFHLIDWKLYGKPDGKLHIPGWRELRPKGGYTAKRRTGGGTVDDGPEVPGFISSYAAVSASEDRAELFAYIVTSPDYAIRRIRGDRLIARKAGEIGRALRLFCPGMAEAAGF